MTNKGRDHKQQRWRTHRGGRRVRPRCTRGGGKKEGGVVYAEKGKRNTKDKVEELQRVWGGGGGCWGGVWGRGGGMGVWWVCGGGGGGGGGGGFVGGRLFCGKGVLVLGWGGGEKGFGFTMVGGGGGCCVWFVGGFCLGVWGGFWWVGGEVVCVKRSNQGYCKVVWGLLGASVLVGSRRLWVWVFCYSVGLVSLWWGGVFWGGAVW